MAMMRRGGQPMRGQSPNDIPRNEYGYPAGSVRAAYQHGGQQVPLSAVDFSGREVPLFIEDVPPLTPQEVAAGKQQRAPRFYCPACKTGLLENRGGIGGNNHVAQNCRVCGVKWGTSDSMMSGIGLESR